jgi:hypothetical protein
MYYKNLITTGDSHWTGTLQVVARGDILPVAIHGARSTRIVLLQVDLIDPGLCPIFELR